MSAEKNIRPADQPVPFNDPECQGYEQVVHGILERAAMWGTACQTAPYMEQICVSDRMTVWKGAFYVYQKGATPPSEAGNQADGYLGTDTYKMYIDIYEDKILGSHCMYTLLHYTGKPFLYDPFTGANLRSLFLDAQETRNTEDSSNFRLEVAAETVQVERQAVVLTLEQDRLLVAEQSQADARLSDKHAQCLVDFLDEQMPENGTGLLPGGTK